MSNDTTTRGDRAEAIAPQTKAMDTLSQLIAEELHRSATTASADTTQIEAAARAELDALLGADLVALLGYLEVSGGPGNVIASFVYLGYDYSLHAISLGLVLTRGDPPRAEHEHRPSPYALFYERSPGAALSPRAWFLRALQALAGAVNEG